MDQPEDSIWVRGEAGGSCLRLGAEAGCVSSGVRRGVMAWWVSQQGDLLPYLLQRLSPSPQPQPGLLAHVFGL